MEMSNTLMDEKRGTGWKWLAPVFLLLLLALFLAAPGTLIDKSYFVCFGI